MELKILEKKPTIDYSDGTYLDLSDNSLLGSFSGFIGLEIVTTENQMRPDLISLKWYGSTNHIDIILKANNLFNPFSIKRGDTLIIPTLNEESKIYKNGAVITKNRVRQKFIDTSRMSNSEKSKIKKIIALGQKSSNPTKTPLPTNMRDTGTTGKKYDNGVIKLGGNYSI